jgi:hypothetical protein
VGSELVELNEIDDLREYSLLAASESTGSFPSSCDASSANNSSSTMGLIVTLPTNASAKLCSPIPSSPILYLSFPLVSSNVRGRLFEVELLREAVTEYIVQAEESSDEEEELEERNEEG